MKLMSIKISNILSFKYYDNLDDCDEIKFIEMNGAAKEIGKIVDTQFNLLIGANGSGKSNFIEIIQYILVHKLSVPYLPGEPSIKDGITKYSFNADKSKFTLEKHYEYPGKEQRVEITIYLTEEDVNEVIYLNENIENVILYFENNDTYKLDDNKAAITNLRKLASEIKDIDKTITLQFDGNNFIQKSSVVDFLKTRNWFKKVIELYNELKIDSDKNLDLLGDNFLVLTSHRDDQLNNTKFQNENQVKGEASALKSNTSSRQRDHLNPFAKVGKKWSRISFDYMYDNNLSIVDSLIEVKKQDIYKEILKTLKELLNITIDLKITGEGGRHNLNFDFFDDRFHRHNLVSKITTLSSGQRCIITLLLYIIISDIKNGLIFFDEPELHLHPQMHKKYLEILQQIGERRKIQFIIATHSAEFLDGKAIKQSYRFKWDINKCCTLVYRYQEKDNNAISKNSSSDVLTDNQLIKILNYMGGNNLFFVDKVILVEGDSDRYFLSSYLKWLSKSEKNSFQNYEIFQIGGKKDRKTLDKWRDFFGKFGIDTFYIGDFDNIDELIAPNLINDFVSEDNDILKKIQNSLKDETSRDGQNLIKFLSAFLNEYELLITNNITNINEENSSDFFKSIFDLQKCFNYIKNRYKMACHKSILKYEQEKNLGRIKACEKKDEKIRKIRMAIDDLYKENIFILKHGDLESYLDISKTDKSFESTVDKCNEVFLQEHGSTLHVEIRRKIEDEFNPIINQIFSNNSTLKNE